MVAYWSVNMKISVIQSTQRFHYDWQNPGDWDLDKCRRAAQPGVDEGLAMVEAAAKAGSQIVVTIEAFNATVHPNDPRYHFPAIAEPLDGPLIACFSALAGRYGVYIVGGLYTGRDDKAYNSAVLFGPQGCIVGVFDKVHMPGAEHWNITPGSAYPVFTTEHGNLGMLVCWDLQFPEAARELALAGADLIAVPTWGWEKRYGLCRAYENGITIAAAMGIPYGFPLWDFCDPSCIVDNMGRILAEGTRAGAQIVSAEVDLRAEPVPQYGADIWTGMHSMRQIRMAQRRPDTYRLVTAPRPPLFERYATMELRPRRDS
jgi:predicted amidohydrolase